MTTTLAPTKSTNSLSRSQYTAGKACARGRENHSCNLLRWLHNIYASKQPRPVLLVCIERGNRTFRHEWLGQNVLETIEEVQEPAAKGDGHTTTIDPTWQQAGSFPLRS